MCISQKYKRGLAAFKAVLTTTSLFLSVEKLNEIQLNEMRLNLDSFHPELLPMLIVGILLYKLYEKDIKYNSRSIKVLSFLFSFFMVMGNSYMETDSWDLVFGNKWLFIISIIIFIGYFVLFKACLSFIYFFLDHNHFAQEKNLSSKFKQRFVQHPFLISLIVMLLCWLPYIISFYPAILSPDPSFQIKQFFGIDTKYSDYAILLDKNVLITNHHPVLHTVLLGSCVKLGQAIGSINSGLFLYSSIQILILSSVLAFSVHYMLKLKLPYWMAISSLLIYALVPAFPFYAMSPVKDVIFASLCILYIIFIYEMTKRLNKEWLNTKKIALISVLLLLLMLFRNNGLHLVILTFPFLLIIDKKNRRKLALIFLCTLCLFGGYSKILLPALKITPGSIRETLSIPFQQTARYVSEYSDELTEKDEKAIDTILDIDTLADRYKPEIADPVKNEFNKYATKEDLQDYFKAWFNGLLKHPTVYIEATMNNTYGYFYPNKTSWYIYWKYDERLSKDGFDYHYNSLSSSRDLLSRIGLSFPYIPVLGFVVNIGFNVWLLFIMLSYLLHIKKYKKVLFLFPALVLLLICIASPVNTYFRYALPFIFGMPLILGLFIDTIRNEGSLHE